MDNPGNRNRC